MASILFRRSNEVSSDDVDEDDTWDDTVLVDAYDKAVGLAMKEVQRRMEQGHDSDGQEKGSKKKTKKKKSAEKKSIDGPVKWSLGSSCKALYSEDGNVYEATILELSSDEETCTVQFIGYNNIQSMPIVELLKTGGRRDIQKQYNEAQLAQESEAQAAAMEWTCASTEAPPPAPQNIHVKKEHPSSSKRSQEKKEIHHQIDSQFNMSIPPPPPISQFTSHLPADEAEALSSMCMAWYMNGFHTGYYMGLKQGQQPK